MSHDALIQHVLYQCIQQGVSTCCIGAGSRSTKLIQALNALNIDIIPFFDERVVGYMALGLIKASKKPVMVVTTSGTAVSNLSPAVTEAANSHLNLIVCTADRPIKYQQTSANQTINQTNIFNDVLAEVQIAKPNVDVEKGLHNIQHALQMMADDGGPIHINFCLEDPVKEAPFEPIDVFEYPSNPILRKPVASIDVENKNLSHFQPALLCIGQLEPWVEEGLIKQIIAQFNLPTVVDGSNHFLKGLPNVCQSADMFCNEQDIINKNEQNKNEPSPKNSDGGKNNQLSKVLYLGGPWISKKMSGYIELNNENTLHVSEAFRPVTVLKKSIKASYESLLKIKLNNQCKNLSLIQHINHNINQHLDHAINEYPNSDLDYIQRAFHGIDQPFDCFVSNSCPIRLFDQLHIKHLKNLYVNRGASGIDGNIATVMGLCQVQSPQPLVAIIGDLASLYDLNAWFMMTKVKRPLSIIIMNNGGGDIFSMLPISKSYPKFNQQFKLSHSIQLTPILKSMGLNCTQVSDVSKLDKLMLNVTSQVVECMTTGGGRVLESMMKQSVIEAPSV